MFPIFHRLSAYPVLHELYGRLVAQCRVRLFPVVKHLDVFKLHCLHLIAYTKAVAMHPLILEAAEPALHQRIIPVGLGRNETLVAIIIFP